MKKARFFSVAVAMVMALFVAVWAVTKHNFGTLNGIIPTGQTTARTAVSCRNITCTGGYLTNITAIKGLVNVNDFCKPATGRVLALLPNGTIIGSVSVPVGTSFNNLSITLPANTYPCNATYCIAGEVKLNYPASASTICGISYTSGSVTFNP